MAFKNLKEISFDYSEYIKPKRFTYESNNRYCTWDFIEVKDSVSVLLYHQEFKSFVFVRQFRIPLWYHQIHHKNYQNQEIGYAIELCSGLIDKNLSLEQIAKEECIEEVGYCPKKLEKIKDFYTGFGSGVSKQSLYFAAINENDRISDGGGIDGEQIEVIFVKIEEYEKFSQNIICNPLLDFSYLWFLKEKKDFYL
ncbi:NUDIX hydrolase [Campylobacter molothri]|uniref:NUDIX hydrolase n=1 Tax=Campylobacter molothri TaxID=1032242 RepID=UPI00301DF624|nr:NUDIX hydrolase [Campylobacter sp. W0067]MBZ7931584.1 NUDIX hydrolase [Campylobacter sp. RM12910]MBZ7933975.1 NUDIX hydrolase [Campylobacter sp. W0065]MBZ7937187.1 NUDIX hydrolase [Campylobacter sp. RM10538]MBZ7962347.1 NUDIX hydrolase [Campylobacter sp. W0049]MBZ7970033.1 NUDIX hydrolase [Campylobacter sp. RM3125]MBZ7971708.1 NUDIX hydrolase [Campylobacter sp. RM3124]